MGTQLGLAWAVRLLFLPLSAPPMSPVTQEANKQEHQPDRLWRHLQTK